MSHCPLKWWKRDRGMCVCGWVCVTLLCFIMTNPSCFALRPLCHLLLLLFFVSLSCPLAWLNTVRLQLTHTHTQTAGGCGCLADIFQPQGCHFYLKARCHPPTCPLPKKTGPGTEIHPRSGLDVIWFSSQTEEHTHAANCFYSLKWFFTTLIRDWERTASQVSLLPLQQRPWRCETLEMKRKPFYWTLHLVKENGRWLRCYCYRAFTYKVTDEMPCALIYILIFKTATN